MTDATASTPTRRWYVAGILALLAPAAGYLYVGQPKRALFAAIVIAILLIGLWHGLNGWVAEPWVALAASALALALFVFFVADSIRLARQASINKRPWYHRWWIYLGVVAVWGVIANLHDIPGTGLSTSIRSFSIPAISMEPTLRIGDFLIADMRAYQRSKPQRGDIIVFKLPRDQKTIFAKRVVGLPGEEIKMVEGVLQIDGVPVRMTGTETYEMTDYNGAKKQIPLKLETLAGGLTYPILDEQANGLLDNTDTYKVPAGHYFVMGDNRDNSSDSRLTGGVGFVPRDNIIGKASWLYWSKDRSRIGGRVR